MLRRLNIHNYALIENAELEFGSGLTIITGETGSGKSIMLGALSQLMGRRADSKMASESKVRIEAEFEDVDVELRSYLEERGVDWIESESSDGTTHNEMTIRREISTSGKSRIFINDTPVTLATLSAIGPRLIDIHSQHANAKLSDPVEQLKVIDVMSDAGDELEEYRRSFRRFATLKRQIDELKRNIARNRENEEVLRFQYDQLEQLKPQRGELAMIERQYELLSDADEIRDRFATLDARLGEGEQGVLTQLTAARSIMDRLDFSMFNINVEEKLEVPDRLQEVIDKLRDIVGDIEDMGNSIDTDPKTLMQLSERMNAYYQAIKHFHVTDPDMLVDLHEKFKNQLSEISGDNGILPDLEKEAKSLVAELKERAAGLSEIRASGALKFAEKITGLSRGLGLQNLRFEVRITPVKLSSTGGDSVEFMAAFNKSGDLMPVGSTASGGEMSRLMLCIKSVMATKINMPTVIFDEVDTGVSGEIAERMGRMMLEMGRTMQVIAITHLPQVASQGCAHYKVYKRDDEDKTVTHVELLSNEARVREIAQMISGTEVAESALETARVLLQNAKI